MLLNSDTSVVEFEPIVLFGICDLVQNIVKYWGDSIVA
jgi:hypothetical protein